MDFNSILVTPAQQELLGWIGERWESLEPGERMFIAGVNPAIGDFIDVHGDQLKIQYSDLEELRDKGLVRYTERGQMGASSRPVAERGAITAEGLEYLRWLREAGGRELSIRLTDEQLDLLVLLVEETRRISDGQQYEFFVSRSLDGAFIITQGERIPAFFPDLEELDRTGVLRLSETNTGAAFVVSPDGFAFYEEIKRLRGEPVDRVEAEARHLLERDIVDSFDGAAQRWREAEDLLWGTDAEDQLTAVGDKCREALQAFAQALYASHCPDAEQLPMERTHNKIRAVLSAERSKLGETTEAALNAYWQAVNDLAERAVHGSQREGRPLLWEDGRRLVFQTLLGMVEIAAAVRD